MKSKANLLNLLVVLSMILALGVLPVSSQGEQPGGAAQRATDQGVKDDANTESVSEPSAPVDPNIRSPRPKPRTKPIPTGTVGPVVSGPYVTEAVAGSYDGDLRDLTPAKPEVDAAGRETRAPLEAQAARLSPRVSKRIF